MVDLCGGESVVEGDCEAGLISELDIVPGPRFLPEQSHISEGGYRQDDFEVAEDLVFEIGVMALGLVAESVQPDHGVLVFGFGHDDGGVFLHKYIII